MNSVVTTYTYIQYCTYVHTYIHIKNHIYVIHTYIPQSNQYPIGPPFKEYIHIYIQTYRQTDINIFVQYFCLTKYEKYFSGGQFIQVVEEAVRCHLPGAGGVQESLRRPHGPTAVCCAQVG